MYIGYVIACWFYNLVAPLTGGIEVEVKDIGLQQPEVTVAKAETIEAPPERKEGAPETNGHIEKL
jgi:hypothetical protein